MIGGSNNIKKNSPKFSFTISRTNNYPVKYKYNPHIHPNPFYVILCELNEINLS